MVVAVVGMAAREIAQGGLALDFDEVLEVVDLEDAGMPVGSSVGSGAGSSVGSAVGSSVGSGAGSSVGSGSGPAPGSTSTDVEWKGRSQR